MQSDAKRIMQHFMKDLLNKALREQGIEDVTVYELSDDFLTAKVVHETRPLMTGWVKTEILLRPGSQTAKNNIT